jgi:PhoPQ-activated pathogenicity-related protein
MGLSIAAALTGPRFLMLVGVLGVVCSGTARAGLIEYVTKPEPAYSWQVKNKMVRLDGVIYDLHLVSQVWQDIKWEHQLQVYQPKDAAPNATMLLWNTGGKASISDMAFGMLLANKIKAPCAFLYHVPNQPLLGDKKEDALIAETFVRFLDTKDDSWPLLFPMVKSVVKAMDALQAFGRQEWSIKIDQFIVSGASKRGWTTWLTAVADRRVKAIAPMVIDTLNMKRQNEHQIEAYGQYSQEIDDYTKRGLVPMPNTPQAKKLWSMVDPYMYRDRLNLPKLIVNGNNDPYWTVDALNLYWDELKGDKWVLYVPNAGHNLQQKGDVSRALNGLAAFARHQIAGKPMPRLHWKHEGDNGTLRLTIEADQTPRGARLWVAQAPTEDFRKSQWVEQAVKLDGNKAVGQVSAPKEGCEAFYAELDFDIDGLAYHLSTQLRVCGKPVQVQK